MSEAPTADELKQQGNEAFAKKDFDKAIQLYNKAISLNPKNHLVFSNRSACHAGKKDFRKSADDAKECIKLDPLFIKGYYRLAMAQMELEDATGAQATLTQGLNLDSGNSQLSRLLQQAKNMAKRQAQTKKQQFTTPTDMPDGISEEMQELQQQYLTVMREARTVEANISYSQREYKSNELTQSELSKLPQDFDGGMYRSIGKIFIKSSREEVETSLTKGMADTKVSEEELTKKQAYLERQLQSLQQNMKELMSAKE